MAVNTESTIKQPNIKHRNIHHTESERALVRDKVILDSFLLRDASLEGSANLPESDVLAAEIVADLQAALEQFAAIAEDLER